ncbi:N-acetyltransferase [Caldisericum exile]|uniref:N-acetyltransferase domain-containing protein n=1 Tax=Caldisericum exile (strain DSM 21853 / NBRC 104410 / AZM16c01) TaxID=511051 RepID=A0A7U6GE29_CALEA|nr:N-acetyltransferase [Caldisericum exile]BAL80671.1 hypothetical protein CSE_05450 [Caldisericum exile AZM16c01]
MIRKLIEEPHSSERVSNFNILLKDLKAFVSVPFFISWYRSAESKKVFPLLLQELQDLNPDRIRLKKFLPGYNPFFKHLDYLQYYLYEENGKPVGRVASLIDRNYKEKKYQGRIGIIGLFEAETREIGYKLLDEAIKDLKNEGCTKIIGPMRFNASGEAGLLIDGFEHTPMPMEPYNPPYYKEIFDQYGEKENDWFSFIIDQEKASQYMERVTAILNNSLNIEEKLRKEGIVIRDANLKDYANEIEKIRKIYNAAWDTIEHPQFEKFSDEEFNYIAASLKQIALPELIYIVEENGNAIGVSVTIPNINEVIKEVDDKIFKKFYPKSFPLSLSDTYRDLIIFREITRRLKSKKFKSARIFILGLLKKRTGLDALLYKRTFDVGTSLGMEYASASQIADTNLNMTNPLMKMGTVGLTWRVYNIRY